MLKRAFLIILSLFMLRPPVLAVPHINPEAFPNRKKDMMHVPSRAQVRRFGAPQNAIIGGASGTKQIAVIIVQFPAGNPSLISGWRTVQSFANIDAYFTQMTNYWSEVSNGNLTLQFRFFGTNSSVATGDATAQASLAYTMPQPMEYYGCGDEGIGCVGVTTPGPFGTANGEYLIRDALQAAIADTGGPISQIGGGTFDAVLIMHAGNGNETTLSTYGDIWSIFYSQSSVITTGGGSFDEGAVFPETESSGIISPLGVMAHEFGHVLGLPDLYNTFFGTSVVGDWDLMDSGPYLNAGQNPAHLGAWCKYSLGWSTPTVITVQSSPALTFVETPPPGAGIAGNPMVKIPVPNGRPQEYFLVEYRTNTAPGAVVYDDFIPGTGLLVWHVDEDLTISRGIGANNPQAANTVNSCDPHCGVSVRTKDGSTLSSSNQGSAGNMFVDGDIFITPQSDNFAGQPSGVSIVNISGVGTANVTMQIVPLAVSSRLHISKLTNYPNPAGKGYFHSRGEGHTTIQFQLTRPARDYSINLYTLSADLVRKISKPEITLNIDRSADNKWVYEYHWNLTNGDGKHVAPGVYLYLIRADGENKSGKAVIIR